MQSQNQQLAHTGNTDQLKEKCAVFGVYYPSKTPETNFDSARLAYYGLWALQHRGQESSGIAASDGEIMRVHSGSGLIATVYEEDDLKNLTGDLVIGHNRYSTSGGADHRHNQPYVNDTHHIALAHNGNLPDVTKLEEFLSERNVNCSDMNDSAMMLAAICTYLDDGIDLVEAIKAAYPLFTGAFSVTIIDRSRLIAFRDECGLRPLALGSLENRGYVVASETCAFDTIGASLMREIEPGEMVIIDKDSLKTHQITPARPRADIFELVYFARPDSILMGKRIDVIRQEFGRELARETKIDADVVVPVPDSAVPAAIGFSQESGISFEMALIKNRYIHRTFIRPTASMREHDLKMKLNPIRELMEGKRVVLVDDSIVRGSTMRHLVAMVRKAGALEVHLLITSPPVLYPDFYGINTPTQAELIAATMTKDEICDHMGADSLFYLSQEGMIAATGLDESLFSTSCFDGKYPISIGKRFDEIRPVKFHYSTTNILDTTPQSGV